MTKNVMASLEDMLEQAGVDVSAAKAGIAELDQAFGGEAGDIPDGALGHWANTHIDAVRSKAFFVLVGKAWEAAIELPEDRKWEKSPKAAEIKAKKNLEAWEKRNKK